VDLWTTQRVDHNPTGATTAKAEVELVISAIRSRAAQPHQLGFGRGNRQVPWIQEAPFCLAAQRVHWQRH